MIKAFILFLVFESSADTVGMHHIEFSSRQACDAARIVLQAKAKQESRLGEAYFAGTNPENWKTKTEQYLRDVKGVPEGVPTHRTTVATPPVITQEQAWDTLPPTRETPSTINRTWEPKGIRPIDYDAIVQDSKLKHMTNVPDIMRDVPYLRQGFAETSEQKYAPIAAAEDAAFDAAVAAKPPDPDFIGFVPNDASDKLWYETRYLLDPSSVVGAYMDEKLGAVRNFIEQRTGKKNTLADRQYMNRKMLDPTKNITGYAGDQAQQILEAPRQEDEDRLKAHFQMAEDRTITKQQVSAGESEGGKKVAAVKLINASCLEK